MDYRCAELMQCDSAIALSISLAGGGRGTGGATDLCRMSSYWFTACIDSIEPCVIITDVWNALLGPLFGRPFCPLVSCMK